MVFSSLPFLFFILPLFLSLDFFLRKSVTLRNISLILISLFFYVFDGGFHSLKILLAYGLLNLVFGYILESVKEKKPNFKNITLFLFVAINLIALGFYKYSYWIVDLFHQLGLLLNVNAKIQTLPLGISFFTFHAISYLIDIARNQLSGKCKITTFLAYFFMFPHLIAGPIVRFKDVKDDLNERVDSHSLFNYGLYRFILGLNKKILIANSVAPLADMAFLFNVNSISTSDAWIGALAYMIQIYFDFSAYSDMAIGLAAMAGFRFHENFNSPYKATSIQDFWRRWHISLSSWLRDYVYIPLGGSRVATYRIYFNLVFVFFLCGLWHGANMTFVIWGLYNGLFLILERVFLKDVLAKLPKVLTHSYALIVVLVGWVIFRADNIEHALEYLKVMFTVSNLDNVSLVEGKIVNYAALILGFLVAFSSLPSFSSSDAYEQKTHIKAYIVHSILVFFSVIILFFNAQNPFIYFNF
ncbi:MBOAT family O-acyltransferase [Succinivibrio faecicola]|uniref:Probable alginate O-acetylase n=1 Tax=Succinivibrio faecicola TaxID=2820300 RepID=A0ABS7DGE0_9GAMM|nr:MBOAT family O-acyltransferase [Succinivibrio faecicola]MBW7570373.1 MBOAT family protein [Succinivibrio faecicola]